MPNAAVKFGTAKHAKILAALQARVALSERAVSQRLTSWSKVEEIYRAYTVETDEDKTREAKKREGKPQFKTLTVPFSYAVLLSAHTYWSSVFLSRSPILQYGGRHGEAQMQVQAVEALMDYQMQVGNMLLPLFVWLLDAGKYGIGIVGNYWEEEEVAVSEIVEVPVTYLGISVAGKTKKKRVLRRMQGYVGNQIYNIRPQDWLPDPRVPTVRFQDGEFCGRKVDISWNTIVKRTESGQYMNVDALKKELASGPGTGVAFNRDLGSPQMDMPQQFQGIEHMDMMAVGQVGAVELCIEIIPRDWELGSSSFPEKWVFTVAATRIIIEAQPYDSWHAKFPFDILESEIEAYGLFKPSMLERMDPLNDALSWLFNTHFFNIRQVLNGQSIVDPSRLQLKDFKTSDPGKLVRVRANAYGQDIRTMFYQIPTHDVTQAHLRDTQLVMNMIQRLYGVTDNIMGMLDPGGRKTATEVRTSSAFGANRLKTQSEYFSALGFGPLSEKMLQNTQQRYDLERAFKIAGDMVGNNPTFIEVTPEQIQGFYDFVPVDGSMPIDRFAQVNMWANLLTQMRNFPQVAEQYDIGAIFAWVAQLGGLKNINRFKINVIPDGDIPDNANPIGGNSGGGQRTGPRGVPSNSQGLPTAGQIPGMGEAG